MNPDDLKAITDRLDLLRDGHLDLRDGQDLVLDVLDLIVAGKAEAARATIARAKRNRAPTRLQVLGSPIQMHLEGSLG